MILQANDAKSVKLDVKDLADGSEIFIAFATLYDRFFTTDIKDSKVKKSQRALKLY